MAYWVLQNIYNLLPVERVKQLVCDDEDEIIVTPPSAAYTKIVTAGTMADNEIDTYLKGHYTVPITPVPAMITDISAIITVYNLHMLSDADDIPEKYRLMYQDAIKRLIGIAAGKIQLTDSAPRSRMAVNKTADDRMFTKELFETYA